MTDHRPSEYGMLFRGQAVKEWPLRHSLARCLPSNIDAEGAINIEIEALKRFQVQADVLLAKGYTPHRKDLPGWWALMQHHHAPTRDGAYHLAVRVRSASGTSIRAVTLIARGDESSAVARLGQ
jgi:hypothetical protein